MRKNYGGSKSKDKIKWIIVSILLLILGAGLIGVTIKLNDSIKTKEVSSSAYAVGTLSSTTGKYVEGTTSIYTEDFITVDGLTVKVKDDANVTYKLFFYDKEKEFISATESLSSDANSTSVVSGAKYFKVMITPNSDPEVSYFEISKYAGRITVTVNK